jgi:cytochrome c peroxidase
MRLLFLITFSIATLLYSNEPIVSIPQSISYDLQKAALGKKLFFDPILSRDHTITCASCHDFTKGGSDARSVSTGIYQQKGSMNSPTVLNSVFNFTQFWNGRAKNLTEQALGPIHNPIEMGLSPKEASSRLSADPFYTNAFSKITGRHTVSTNDIAVMIAEYEKTLITPNAKFDLFLKGKVKLSSFEKEGYALFKTFGCVTCHNGVNVGGNSFQKMGLIYPVDRNSKVDDRYTLTKREADKNVFKVPTLRNIALTAPYFHDGSALTLYDAVQKMSHHNLGIKPTSKEISAIVAFLKTLTGDIPK